MPTNDQTTIGRAETVLEEAERLVGGERLQHYGPPTDNFTRIARLWASYLGLPEESITCNDVCAMFILSTQSRMKTSGFHRDSATDTCGYARLQEILASDPDFGR